MLGQVSDSVDACVAASALSARTLSLPAQYARASLLHLELLRQTAPAGVEDACPIVFCLRDIVMKMTVGMYFKVRWCQVTVRVPPPPAADPPACPICRAAVSPAGVS